MKFISPYLEKSFLIYTLKYYLIGIAAGFFLGFSFFVITEIKYDSQHRRDKVYKIVTALENMSIADYQYACSAGILLAFVFIIIWKFLDKSERIVVYLDFDDTSQRLLVKTRNSTKNNMEEFFIPYAQLQLKGRYNSNVGQKKHTFEGVEILKNHVTQGFVLENHISWSIEEFIRIKTKLFSIAKLG